MVNYFNRNGKNGNGKPENSGNGKNGNKLRESTVSSWLTGKLACFVYGAAGGYLLFHTGLLPQMVQKLSRSKNKELEKESVSTNSNTSGQNS
jgi:hypothetical protein